VGSAASQFFINAKNKKYVELKYRQIIWEVFRRSRYGTARIIHKGRTASVEIKSPMKKFDFALQVD
jgi:hypothetical protein